MSHPRPYTRAVLDAQIWAMTAALGDLVALCDRLAGAKTFPAVRRPYLDEQRDRIRRAIADPVAVLRGGERAYDRVTRRSHPLRGAYQHWCGTHRAFSSPYAGDDPDVAAQERWWALRIILADELAILEAHGAADRSKFPHRVDTIATQVRLAALDGWLIFGPPVDLHHDLRPA